MMPLGRGIKKRGYLLASGLYTQYNSELDDGYYKIGIPRSYTALTTGQYSGTTNVVLAHYVGTGVSFSGSAIVGVGTSLFVATGGETLVISGAGSAGNNGTVTTGTAVAGSVTLTSAVITEAPGATITISKSENIPNLCVFDNNTGLTWLKQRSLTMGVLGTGLMPWTGQVFDIFAFVAACNAASLAGFSDWRIPNNYEAYSILWWGATTNAPDPAYFGAWSTNVQYWTSTTRTASTTQALYMGIASGTLEVGAKTLEKYVILVRG